MNRPEVTAAVETVRRLAADGVTSIGVITPFRAQADAIESALAAALSVEELERLAVRVGTVHAFQGNEAHTVVVSLGLTDDDSVSRVRFVTDPQLFNVMVTRARERLIVITSLSGPDGLIGEFLAYGEAVRSHRPKWRARAGSAGSPTSCAPWGCRCGSTTRSAGGAWTSAWGRAPRPSGSTAWSILTGSRRRWRVNARLTRAGWRMVDAYPSRWGGDPVRAALELSARWGSGSLSRRFQ